jgi:hypothetical protein
LLIKKQPPREQIMLLSLAEQRLLGARSNAC